MNFRMFVAFMLALVMIGAWFAACVIYRAAEVGELVSPLETRVYEHLTLTAVGTGSSYENPTRLGPSTAVSWGSNIVLVDVGRGVGDALRRSKIPLQQPQLVVLTHLMPINTLGLDELLFTGWLRDRKTPLRVLGPPGTRAFIDGLTDAYRIGRDALGSALPLETDGARFLVEEIDDGWSETIDDVTIRAASLPNGPLPALAYRFEAAGRSVVVAPTGWAHEALLGFARGAHVLVHEAAFVPSPDLAAQIGLDMDTERLRREAALHTSIEAVGDLALRAGVETLVLVRLRPPPVYDLQITGLVDDRFGGRIVIADDGDEIRP
jgi:ribonuclease Z